MILKFVKHSVPLAFVPLRMALATQDQIFKFWLGAGQKHQNNVVDFKKAASK